mmetsp:Transcript_45268/g.120061  ORF Transcript_45268/g.120061 Transcript_45268/m.120061 type:complete len:275 (-) Transcript_45268:63-887(-)
MDGWSRAGGALGWLHGVVVASRTTYPLPLMVGFTLYGNILLRRDSGGKRYPSWIFGVPVGLICYTYAGSLFSEIVFQGISPRCLGNDNILIVFCMWYVLVQHCDPFYKFCTQPRPFILINTWWFADSTRVSLLTLERAVTNAPSGTFAKGIWQAWFWCAVPPIARCIELGVRTETLPKLEVLQPQSLNAFQYPLVSMFFVMMAYYFTLANLTDCDIFAEDGISAEECGARYSNVYAGFVYLACGLHLARGFHGRCTRKSFRNADLQAPLLNKQR